MGGPKILVSFLIVRLKINLHIWMKYPSLKSLRLQTPCFKRKYGSVKECKIKSKLHTCSLNMSDVALMCGWKKLKMQLASVVTQCFMRYAMFATVTWCVVHLMITPSKYQLRSKDLSIQLSSRVFNLASVKVSALSSFVIMSSHDYFIIMTFSLLIIPPLSPRSSTQLDRIPRSAVEK